MTIVDPLTEAKTNTRDSRSRVIAYLWSCPSRCTGEGHLGDALAAQKIVEYRDKGDLAEVRSLNPPYLS